MELESAVDPTAANVIHGDEFSSRARLEQICLTRERRQKLRQLATDAIALAGTNATTLRRVNEAIVSLDAFDIWSVGTLVEQDGRLVRGDLENQYTYDRAVNVTNNSRYASPREWAPPPSYYRQFVATQGGPLTKLKSGELEVTVAPAVGMRTWQLTFKGRPLLAVPDNNKLAGWPNVWGQTESEFPGWVTGWYVGEPTATSVVMRAEVGSGASQKQAARRALWFDDSGALHTEVSALRYARDPNWERVSGNNAGAYQVGKEGGFVVEALTSNGWSRLSFSVPTNALAVKGNVKPTLTAQAAEGAQALRLTLSNAACVVEERYLAPAIRALNVDYDPNSGVLQTAARTVNATAPLNTWERWLHRRLTVTEMAK